MTVDRDRAATVTDARVGATLNRAMLDDRKTAILSAVVQEYITTAQPVGSNLIAEAPSINVSSATVRSEMAQLEHEGYLVQPHTGCAKFTARFGIEATRWINSHKDLRLRGICAIVAEPGTVSPGDPIVKVG